MSRSIRSSARVSRAAVLAARVFASTAAVAALPASAHGFGQRYDLPLPLSLYLGATASAIVLSFVVAALFVRDAGGAEGYPHHDLLVHRLGRFIASSWVACTLKVLCVILFIVTVAAGLVGNPDPYRNIAPTLIWVVGWVGLVYVSAFVGDIWPIINPWRTLFETAGWAARISGLSPVASVSSAYPQRLGVWPAFVLLFVFSWTELVYPSPALPLHIAVLMLAYSLVTWLGMALFGRDVWLQHAEVFTVVFAIFARFAPFEARSSDGRRRLLVRPFASGLAAEPPASTSITALILLILATVLFDGALATPQWNRLETLFLGFAPGYDNAALLAVRTLGLGAAWCVLFGAYLAVCGVMSAAAGQRSAWELARTFAWTLVPIAVGYHLAHYFVYLLVQGQYIVPILSDPFGYGWNLFGTAGYRADVGLVGARFAWYLGVGAIVVGHVIAVVLAHRRALRLFARAAALKSQVPLTALMVAYTFVSLSILAQPITERAAPAEDVTASAGGISVPADALLPEAGAGGLRPVGSGRIARQKLTYRMLGSAFHDGTSTSPADILYAFAFAYRWGNRSEAEPGHYDPAIDAATRPLREHLLGLKITGTDTTSKSFRVADVNVVRELFVIDVYTDLAPGDPEQDAALTPPWTTVPWHVLVLMEEAVARGFAAFSRDEAARRGVEWLDLVRSEALGRRLAQLVETFAREGYRPDALRTLVTPDEARKRWTALEAFYRERGHFLVTNGPYRLKRWSDGEVELDVFRDLSYPLGVGSFDAYAIPRRGFVTEVERTKDGLRLTADIETIMRFQRSYEIHRNALRAMDPNDVKRSAPECRYVVVDDGGRVVLAGTAYPSDDASFRVPLGGVAPGRYTVRAEIVVAGNAMNADIRRIPVQIGPR